MATQKYNPLKHKNTSVFRDPIHGLIPVYEWELALIDTECFQRLRRIHQLSMTYYVYHGAEHTRFGHSIGVMHIAGRVMDHLRDYEPLKSLTENEFFVKRALVRMVALLHDLGHGCFSHVGEGANIYPSLEDPAGGSASGHEVYTRIIIKEKLSDIIEKFWPKKFDMVNQILMVHSQGSCDSFRFFDDIISGQLDCDKMDYLLRDSHYCGVQYGVYDLDKLIHSLRIAKIAGNNVLAISQNGIQAVEGFVLARYWMFIQVYFHKDRRLFDHYLTGFISQYLQIDVCKSGKYPTNVDQYLKLDDGIIREKIQQYAKAEEAKDTEVICNFAKKIYYRTHHKVVFDPPYAHFNSDDKEQSDAYQCISYVYNKIDECLNSSEKNPIWNPENIYMDLANGSSIKNVFDIKAYNDEEDPDYNPQEPTKKISPAIPVISKISTNSDIDPDPIQKYSFVLRSISDRKISILRVYADNSAEQVESQCNNWFYNESISVKQEIEETDNQIESVAEKRELLVEQEKQLNEKKQRLSSKFEFKPKKS